MYGLGFATAAILNQVNNAQMKMQSQGRIDINGQFGHCDRSDVCVSRAMPACLGGYMSRREWSSFCDALDQALLPMNQVKKVQFFLMVGLGVFFVIVMSGSFVSVASIDISDGDTSFTGNSSVCVADVVEV